jgi:hypothetical protein
MEGERVGLQMPLVHKCRQRGGVHHRQIAEHEASKRQEPGTSYERRVLLIPRQGVVRVDLEQQQSLCNTTMVQKY